MREPVSSSAQPSAGAIPAALAFSEHTSSYDTSRQLASERDVAKGIATLRNGADSRQQATETGSPRPTRATKSGTSHLERDSQLDAVIDAWPDLPAAIRAGIVAMVKPAERPEEFDLRRLGSPRTRPRNGLFAGSDRQTLANPNADVMRESHATSHASIRITWTPKNERSDRKVSAGRTAPLTTADRRSDRWSTACCYRPPCRSALPARRSGGRPVPSPARHRPRAQLVTA
jgi:hypothetical protein